MMSSDLAMSLVVEMLWIAITVSAPILGLILAVGLLVSVFQVVTQIQEMTLAFVPKLLAVAIAIMVFGAWMLTTILQFSTSVIANIPLYF
jgi:flagellar biosynthetic protein FliQ